jgi:group II intron reverse transcriptase/maturase
MQSIFDDLYAESKRGELFSDMMELILSRENILLAYRNIKTNHGSNTPGTDKLTIKDVGRLSPDEVVNKIRFIVQGSSHGYRPKPVRRKNIPKDYDPARTRPLGIPCIWDRMVQQCIKQVMEPICEAKFSENSFGFRPNRSVEHAISRTYSLLNLSKLHYIIEFDIKAFFDEVNHSKLIKQIWAMGIRDKHLIWVIRQILNAPVKMPDGKLVNPGKGTPQGGIISPILANIVLNELDCWVES